jgi:hypothetical protein
MFEFDQLSKDQFKNRTGPVHSYEVVEINHAVFTACRI